MAKERLSRKLVVAYVAAVLTLVGLLPSNASAAAPAAPSVTVPASTVTDPRQAEFTISGGETDLIFYCKFEYMTDFFLCADTGGIGPVTGNVLYSIDDPTPPSGDATHQPDQYDFFVRPGTHTLSVEAKNSSGFSSATTSSPFTMDWNERARVSYDGPASVTLNAYDASGNQADTIQDRAGISDGLVSAQDASGLDYGEVDYYPLDASFADLQEPSTRTLYFCVDGTPGTTIDYRIANDDAGETPQTASVTLGASALYIGSSSPPGLGPPSFLDLLNTRCGEFDSPGGGGGGAPSPSAAPAPPAPAPAPKKKKKKKCKKAKKSATSAKKKKC